MGQNKLPLDPCHVGVPSGVSKMIFEPMVHSMQTVHLYELSLDPRHVGVPSGGSKVISKTMVRSVQTEHLSCANINTISKQTETNFHLIHDT
jgi:hypothetical protein